jgi:hypothetical protein
MDALQQAGDHHGRGIFGVVENDGAIGIHGCSLLG